MAYLSRTLEAKPASDDIRKKHYYRTHGAGAYYGQKKILDTVKVYI